MDARAFIAAMNAEQSDMAQLPPNLLGAINGLIECCEEQIEMIATMLVVNRKLLDKIDALEGR